jgi:hypothetical protein
MKHLLRRTLQRSEIDVASPDGVFHLLYREYSIAY